MVVVGKCMAENDSLNGFIEPVRRKRRNPLRPGFILVYEDLN
jgi:hypothetical protein